MDPSFFWTSNNNKIKEMNKADIVTVQTSGPRVQRTKLPFRITKYSTINTQLTQLEHQRPTVSIVQCAGQNAGKISGRLDSFTV